ncbi:MAG: hypothetical protein NT075_21090 [Chloroflexi bacterium]|nr:hypothetical protein [Chloroflexota bacterium]
MPQKNYTIGPVTVGLACTNEQQLTQLDALWQTLFHTMPAPVAAPPAIQFQFNHVWDRVMYPLTAELFRQPHRRLWQTPMGFHLTCGDTWLALDVVHLKATGMLASSFADNPLVEQREFFQLAFLLLLRRHNVHLLSANGIVSPKGAPAVGMLLVGDGAVGKTTLSISLLAAGWRYVADEQLMLQSNQTPTVVAYALRRGFACTPQTVSAFPRLADACVGSVSDPKKKLYHLETIYPDCFVGHCIPHVILFPQLTPTASSWLVPLDAKQTMSALLHQLRSDSIVDSPTVMGQLVLLKALARQTRGYQIHLGRDVLAQPARVGELLLTICQAS